MIDLRSDTVTKPSQAMRAAMMDATVGDDVFGEDPTVNALEEKAANMFGQEAGLYCASGTMTNQIALQVHTRPGDEVICSALAHIYLYEGGGMAKNSGLSPKFAAGDRGRLSAESVSAAINPDDPHFCRSTLVALEDTCNKGGGCYYDFAEVERIHALCRKKDLKLHLDGARVFNALAENNIATDCYGAAFDSISICLSKGLGAPVGSVLVGSKDFIYEARRVRKSFGGGMRQAGILAAAGIYALDHNVARLATDHRNAKILAEAAKKTSFVTEIVPVVTNIVICKIDSTMDSSSAVQKLEKQGIASVPFGFDKIRFVTHLDFSDQDLARACEILEKL